ATVNIWKIFCNSGVPFKYNHMQYLSHATHEEVLGPLFKGFLPKLFKMESTTTYYLSVEDPNNQEANDQNAEGQHEETSVNITLPIDCNYTTSKSDHKILESDDQNDELIMWFEVLSNLNDHLMISNDGKLATNEFKQYLRAFMDKIDVSQFKNNKRRPFDLSDHQSKKKQRNNILISNSK
ncbi:13_t:CDS:1, partial [Acaulospora morrowiae]